MRRRGLAVRLAFIAALLMAAPLTWAQGSSAPEPSGPVELLDKRTATSKTFRLPGGRELKRLYSAPVHFRDGGTWKPIDATLIPTAPRERGQGYTWRTRSNGFGVLVKDALEPGFLRFDVERQPFEFELEGARRVAARTGGARVQFADAFPGVDLRYEMRPEGVKEELVLRDAGAPATYRFTLRPPDRVRVDHEPQPDGSHLFRTAGHGRAAFLLTPAFATDAPHGARRTGAATHRQRRDQADHVRMTVERTGGSYTVELRIDPEWLRDPQRRFPVTVDPTIAIQPTTRSAEFTATCPGCAGYDWGSVWIGADDIDAYRGGFQFDVGQIPPDAKVSSATFGLYNQADWCVYTTTEACGARSHTLDVHRMTKSWTANTTTRNLLWDASPLASYTLPAGAGDQWMSWGVTGTVQSWISGTQPNYGFLVKRSTEPLDVGGPEVPGGSWIDGDPALRPRLDVVYVADAVRFHKPETLHGNGADLRWDRFDGSTGAAFQSYEVHRSATAGFTPSAETRVATISDAATTTYRDTTAAPNKAFSYKIVTNGKPSIEQRVTLPAEGQAKKVLQSVPEEGEATYISDWDGPSDCTNAGRDEWLYVGSDGYRDRSLLRFDLRDIPAGASITSADLSLWMTDRPGAAMTVGAHRATSAWTEGTGYVECTGDGASWAERVGSVPWGTPGGDYVAGPVATKAHASGDPRGWDVFDIAPAVQTWVSGGAPNHGILLRTTDETDVAGKWLGYWGDDTISHPARRPKLAVTYADGSRVIGPEAAISAPGSSRDPLQGTVAVAAAASDDQRVDKVEFLLDGNVAATDAGAPYEWSWDTRSAANGDHRLTVRATDDAGNTKTSPAVDVVIGNSAPPQTRVTSPAGAYPDVVKADDPAAYWRLGETSGTTAADASGHGRDGAYGGTIGLSQPSLVAGQTDAAARLGNGTADGIVSVPGLTGALGARLTAEAWIDYPALPTAGSASRVVSRKWGSAGGWALVVEKTAAGEQRARFSVNQGGTVHSAGAPVAPGRRHLAGSYDGSTLRLYVDGAPVAGQPLAGAALDTAAAVELGGALEADVVLDDAAVFDRALSADQVRGHAEVGTGRPVTVAGQETVTAAASDDGSVARVEFYVDGDRFAEDTSAPYAGTLETTGAEPVYDGTHQVTTKAYDEHGQVTASSTTEIAVVNTAGTRYVAELTATPAPQAVTYDPNAAVQDEHGMEVTVRNASAQPWSATDVVLRSRWIPPDPGAAAVEGREVPLGAALAPGASRTVTVGVEAPPLPAGVDKAKYKLQVDAYEKSTGKFFADKGNKPVENPVIVNKELLTGLGLEKYYHYEGEQLGAGMTHLLNVANGNSLVRWTPFSSTGRGLSTVLDLTYNSLEKKSESPVGNNFSIAISGLSRLGNPIDIHPNKADEIAGRANKFVEITDGDGTTHRFEGRQAADGSTYWEEPEGVHLYLRSLGGADPARRWAFTRPDRVTFYYDADGYPTGVEDANRNRLTYVLEDTPPGQDPGGPKKRVARVTDAGGRSYDIAYYGKADAKKPQIRGKVRRITDHTGNALDFEYYEDGNLLRLIQRGGTNADGSFLPDRAFVFTYTTSNGEGPALTAAERANPDPKTPNQSTRLFSVRDPRGHESTFAYLGTGEGQDRWKLASRTDRAGHTTAFSYDTATRVTTVTAPLSRVTRFGYDVEGKVTSIVNPKQERTLVAWTDERHVAKVTAPTGREQRFEYDANGYLTKEWDELDRLTEIAYDHLPVDGNDVPGKWKPGRGVEHISQVKSRKTPRGKLWSFGHDERGNLTSVTDPENSVTRHVVNLDGTLARTTDANGNVTRFPAYDLNGLATEMVREMDDLKDDTGPDDRVTRFQHDADGLMLWVQDPLHRGDTGADPREYRTYFDYDSFQRMGRQSVPKSTEHAPGRLIWTGARFDQNDNLVAQVGAHYGEEWSPQLGTVAEHAYDAMDRQVESERPHEPGAPATQRFKTQTRYDAAGRLVQVTSPRGVATPGDDRDFAVLYDHDPLDRVIRLRRYGDPGDGSQQTRITHFCFDLAGDLRSITTPRAQLPEVQCAANGAPPATPYTSRIEYTPAHEVSAQVDANGKRRESRYDLDGNLVSSKDEHGTEETRDYNGRDQVIKVTRPVRGGDSPHAAVTRIEYDAAGNPERVFSPRAHDKANGEYVTTYEYNAADELVRKVLPDDGSTTQAYEHSAYDANGNLEKSTLPVEQETLAATERDEPDAVRTMEYFDPGWLLSSDDENPKITYDYRAEGWQVERIPSDRDGDERRDRRSWIEYYPDGQPKAEYDRAGRPTEFRYDANNNLTYALDKGVEDGKQRPLETTATYDGFDEVATTVLEQEGEDDRRSKFLYDPNGNTRERWDDRQADASGSTTKEWRHHRFTYDPVDRVELHEDFGRKDEASDDRRITTSYFDTGWKKRRVIARQVEGSMRDSQTTDWTYFLNGQLDTLETKARPKDSETWQTKESHDLEYIRDDVYFNGHRVEDRFQRDTPKTGGSCKESPCTQTFQYDARDRLTQENNGAGTTRNYTLDPAGNVTIDRGGPAGEVRAEYRGGQMVWQEAAGHRSWQHYDDWGNLDCVASSDDRSVCEGAQGSDRDPSVEQDYHYDANDVLLSFDEFGGGGDKSVDYVNDAFDRPVEERERQGSDDPKSKLYSYIGLTNQLADEEEFKREEPGGEPSKTRSYTYGPDGERIAMTYENKEGSGGEKDFGYGFDPQGSVSLLIDDAGKAQASYGYSAYGERDEGLTQEQDPETGAVVDQTKDTVNPYRYTDKRWSPVSEQLDMGARRFAPSLHSFIQDDRYEQAFDDMELATDPLTQNRYSLAGGNPVSFVEVDGHFFDPIGAIEDAGEAIGDAGEFAGEVGEGFAGNVADTAVGAYQTASWANRSFNPASAISDPKGFGEQWKANYEGGKAIAENPEAAAKAVADSFTEGYRRGSTGNKIGHGIGDAVGIAGIVGAATKGAKAAGAAGRAGRALSSCARNSFTGSTLVLMADGATKPIVDIAVGDRVQATDPRTGATVARRVQDVIVGHGTKRLVRVTIGGRTLTTTPGHPFWVQDRGAWIAAEDLEAGDLLREPDGELTRVGKVRLLELADQRVYNLTVAGVHTYHAGAALVLVHNCARDGGSDSARQIEEGIYEFQGTTGLPYIGSSKHISRRLRQHVRSGAVAEENAATAGRTEVTGGRTAREVAEQGRIDERGGVANLQNERNPIGPKRRYLMSKFRQLR